MTIIRRRSLLYVLWFASILTFLGASSVPAVAAVPVFTITPATVTFGVQTVGTSSGSTVLQVTNTGGADLVISNIALTGANASDFRFMVAPFQARPSRSTRGTPATGSVTFPFTIPVGGTSTVLVAFSPTATGTRTAALTFTDNAAGSPHSVNLSGTTNSAGALVSPTSFDFGSVFVGDTSASQPITVTNNGTGTLVLSNLVVLGTNSSDFQMSLSAPPQTGRRSHRLMRVAVPPAGTATVNVSFKPTATGSRSASLNIGDNATGNLQTVTLTGTAATPLGHLSISDVSLGANLEKLISVSVDNAPGSELNVTITSSDPSKVVLSTDTNGVTAGTGQITAPIHAGANSIFPGFYVQALGTTGTAQLTVSAPNYASATANVTIGPSGFVLIGPDATSNDFSTYAGSTDSSMTVAVKNLDSSNNPFDTSPPARIRGGLTVNVPVNSATTTVGTIVGGPSQFTGSSSNGSSVTFHPLAVGTTVLSLGTPDQTGFTTPGTGTQLTATVTPPVILVNPATIGSNLEVNGSARLSTPAPTGGLMVTITSSDPNKVLLSTDTAGTSMGSESIMLNVPEGQGSPSGFPGFVIQSLAFSGTVQLTATAPGYQDGIANVALTPSGFLIDGGKGNGVDFSTTPISADTPLKISAVRLDSQLNFATTGTLRGGAIVVVGITSGTPSVGDVTSSDAVFVGGDSTNSEVSFHPSSTGTTLLTLQQPGGFSNATAGTQLNAVVGNPAIALNFPVSKIGKNLQVQGFGALNAPAPAGGLVVTISSNNANVLVSTAANTQGSSSIQVTVPEGKGVNGVQFPIFYVQGTSDTGSATITASATGTGFDSTTANVSLAKSGFTLTGPNGLGKDFATLHGSTNIATLTVTAYQLNTDDSVTPEAPEALRGGITASVPVTLSNPDVGSITTSPVAFSGGVTSVNTGFQPGANVGTSLITAVPPSGFKSPTGASLTVNVN